MSTAWKWFPYRVPFKKPITTAHGPWCERLGYWVMLEDGHGLVGLGEVAPLPLWGTENLADARNALEQLRAISIPLSDDVEKALESAGLNRSLTPATYAGCEVALLDLLAQQRRLPLAGYLNPLYRPSVRLNALIITDSPQATAGEALERVKAGYTTLKIKVGCLSLDAEMERLRSVRQAIGPQVALRLDANGAWEPSVALLALEALAEITPEYVEQPVAAADLKGLLWLAGQSAVPVAADESIHSPAGALALMKGEVAALILKPLALGGLLATRRLVEQALRAHKRVVLSSVLDRGVGTLACLHLAAALGDALAPCGLASGEFFEGPRAIPQAAIVNGRWYASNAYGLGLSSAHRAAMLTC